MRERLRDEVAKRVRNGVKDWRREGLLERLAVRLLVDEVLFKL